MSVQTSSQALLVEVMGDQADASSQNEETVENTHLQVVFSLFWTKSTAIAHKIDEADSDAAVNVENEVVLLGCCHGLNCNRIFEHFTAWEALLDKFFDKLYTEVGIITRFNLMANTRDWNKSVQNAPMAHKDIIALTKLILFTHGIYKVARAEALV